jgi:hypothetical protein
MQLVLWSASITSQKRSRPNISVLSSAAKSLIYGEPPDPPDLRVEDEGDLTIALVLTGNCPMGNERSCGGSLGLGCMFF